MFKTFNFGGGGRGGHKLSTSLQIKNLAFSHHHSKFISPFIKS